MGFVENSKFFSGDYNAGDADNAGDSRNPSVLNLRPSPILHWQMIAMNDPVESPTSGSRMGIQEESIIRNHPVYWLDDGSLVLDVEVQRFKVHRTLLSRHSRFFASLSSTSHESSGSGLTTNGLPTVVKTQGFDHIVLEQRKEVRAEDVEALLQHLYHDV